MAQDKPTTIQVHGDTHERLEELKPFDSMSFDELLNEMADLYEGCTA